MRKVLLSLSLSLLLTGCLNHFVYHPKEDPPGVTTWSEQAVRGKLLLRLEWAKPAGEGPFPAVLVHPEAGHTAGEMRGVVKDLARAGYLALAADYRRLQGGVYRDTLFTWRDPDDPRAAFDILRSHPLADRDRIGLVGFSQGGVYSLLIAAYTGQAAAVVAYYPVTDFEAWMNGPHGDRPGEAFIWRMIRRHFRRSLGAKDDAELSTLLGRASAMKQAEAIRAPVLLIHGNRDTSAPLAESERLAGRLRELGREVELVVVPDAGHVFNFRDRDKARTAWEATLGWLDRHLKARRLLGRSGGPVTLPGLPPHQREEVTCMSLLPRKDIEPLLRVSGGPCVSIFLPTFRAGGERQQNPIRLKNVVRNIAERLEEDWGMRSPDADELLDPVKRLVDDNSFWLHQSDGLALFLSPDTFKSFRLPMQLNELAVVENRFHLKPLLPLLSGDGDGHFYVLSLSRKNIRLLSGSRFQIEEIDLEARGIPTNLTQMMPDVQRNQTQFHVSTSNKTPHRLSVARKGQPVFAAHGTGEDDLGAEILYYFNRFDDALARIDLDRKAPVVLAGVEYLLPIYRDAATTFQNICEEALLGNMEWEKPEDLHAAAWEIVEPHFLQERRKAAERFGDLSGSGRSSTDLNVVLPAAHDGRVESLFVARGVRVWGSYEGGERRKITFQPGQDGPRNGNEDLLDLAAVQTYLNGGKVFVVDQKDVPEGRSLAAVFRY